MVADSPRQVAGHVGRILLGILFPLAALAACITRRVSCALGPLLVAVAILAQPLVSSPDWIVGAEPRLAGLAVPALAVAAAMFVARIRIRAAIAGVVCAALFAGSFHHIYSNVDLGRSVWIALTALAAAFTFLALLTARLRSEPIQRQAAVAVGDR